MCQQIQQWSARKLFSRGANYTWYVTDAKSISFGVQGSFFYGGVVNTNYFFFLWYKGSRSNSRIIASKYGTMPEKTNNNLTHELDVPMLRSILLDFLSFWY